MRDANRTPGILRTAGAREQAPAVEAEPLSLSLREAQRRWVELLRRIFDPHCSVLLRFC